ncbi:3349_t:CDS:2 [Scutellospora calospora]|uniref:3349_t:CDS:1 n=1 Tax=Scutellospora calospora TaxID=85575 RepID=A0ACA9JVV9_9GLOM|nr:3349_t:CDS:2 [Scutellospora calospora]
MKRQRNSYTVEEKCKAVDLACLFPQNNLRSIGSGRHVLFPEEEAQLYE